MEHTLQIFLSIVPAIAAAIFGWFMHKIKKRDELREAEERERTDKMIKREKAVNDALRALCRDRILQGYRYYRKHDGVSTADLETMTKLYNAYHGLSGNGTVTAIYDKICALPIREESS